MEGAVEDEYRVAGEVHTVAVDSGVHQPGTGRRLEPGEAVPAQPV